MQSASGADVVPLASFQARKETRELNAACPGWHPWYSVRLGLWIAHRCGNWNPVEAGDRRRTFSVTAADADMLRAQIDEQAFLDLQVDFPEWDVSYADNGLWWATWAGRSDGRVRPVFCQPSPVTLAASVRHYVASVDEPDPCPAWW